MSRASTAYERKERSVGFFDRRAQAALTKKRETENRAREVAAARADLERALGTRSPEEAELYLAELRRLLERFTAPAAACIGPDHRAAAHAMFRGGAR